jgi:hypothetical protein
LWGGLIGVRLRRASYLGSCLLQYARTESQLSELTPAVTAARTSRYMWCEWRVAFVICVFRCACSPFSRRKSVKSGGCSATRRDARPSPPPSSRHSPQARTPSQLDAVGDSDAREERGSQRDARARPTALDAPTRFQSRSCPRCALLPPLRCSCPLARRFPRASHPNYTLAPLHATTRKALPAGTATAAQRAEKQRRPCACLPAFLPAACRLPRARARAACAACTHAHALRPALPCALRAPRSAPRAPRPARCALRLRASAPSPPFLPPAAAAAGRRRAAGGGGYAKREKRSSPAPPLTLSTDH